MLFRSAEGVGVRDDEDDEDACQIHGEGALDLARQAAGEGCGGLEFFNHGMFVALV